MAVSGPQKPNLGRGLSTLLGDLQPQAGDLEAVSEQLVPIEKLRPNPMQPRTDFDQDKLEELTNSIREKGILQPLIVRPDPENPAGWMIVAGERRWRAAQKARLHDIPVVSRDLSDAECLEIGLIENIQRSDLNPMEEARAYRQLMDRFSHTQENLSVVIGKSRSFIANRLRLLNLPEDVQQRVRAHELSAGHARALGVAPNPSRLAQKVVNLNLSVRQTEELVRKAIENPGPDDSSPRRVRKDANTRILEAALSASLKTAVRIEMAGKGGSGRVVLKYTDLDQLETLCNRLRRAGISPEPGN